MTSARTCPCNKSTKLEIRSSNKVTCDKWQFLLIGKSSQQQSAIEVIVMDIVSHVTCSQWLLSFF